MAYRIAAIRMTLNDLQSHSPTASFLSAMFSYGYAAVDKITTDMVHRAVHLR